MGEKQVILKLRKEGETIRAIAQGLGISSRTLWNILKKKEFSRILTTSHKCSGTKINFN